ncbi:MDR family MFS transporter [Brachybacterium fresconis]|uniref:DHA2 family lincomycin resistance protein-like MFS transporter n=1 Tax=Brachybacterium fresconis TaxID=173363 RepID=A0ABS4YIS7_9MICO|nr:MDR family MFS transporter [Brachybacterium fresconis]MBP2408410.1 DHA2 family lincomycin resistance protein-like MFS transporter [Brachybacterium fresconis]
MSQTLSPGSAAPGTRSSFQRPEGRAVTSTLAVLVIAALVMLLNETVLSVALPSLMADFSIEAATAQWLTTAFLLTMAVVIPTTGFLLQRFRTRQLFIASMSLFLVGTALAAFAPTFLVILVGRVIQALCAAILMPLLMNTTMTLVAPEKRGAVMGVNSIVISVAPAIGPTLSGIVIESLSWRWVFGLMLPIAAVLFLVGAFVLRDASETRRAPLDIASVLLSVAAFGGIVFAFAHAAEIISGAWITPVVAAVIGLVGLVAFVRRQLVLQARDGSALLDLSVFRYRDFSLSVVILFLGMATMLGAVVTLPIFLQGSLGLLVIAVGFVTLPGGLLQAAVAPIIGRLYDRVGPTPLLVPGTLLLAAGMAMLILVDLETSVAWIVGSFAVFSVGMGILMTTLMTSSLGSVPRRLYGHGSAVVNTMQQLGGAFGTAGLVTALTIGMHASPAGDAAIATAHGTQRAFGVGLALALVAVVLAFFVRRPPLEVIER